MPNVLSGYVEDVEGQLRLGSISCKTEYDAKLLARELVKKGYRVSAETL